MTLTDKITRALCAHLSPEDAEARAEMVVADIAEVEADEELIKVEPWTEVSIRGAIWSAIGRYEISERVPLHYRDEVVTVIYSMHQREAEHERGTDRSNV